MIVKTASPVALESDYCVVLVPGLDVSWKDPGTQIGKLASLFTGVWALSNFLASLHSKLVRVILFERVPI